MCYNHQNISLREHVASEQCMFQVKKIRLRIFVRKKLWKNCNFYNLATRSHDVWHDPVWPCCMTSHCLAMCTTTDHLSILTFCLTVLSACASRARQFTGVSLEGMCQLPHPFVLCVKHLKSCPSLLCQIICLYRSLEAYMSHLVF